MLKRHQVGRHMRSLLDICEAALALLVHSLYLQSGIVIIHGKSHSMAFCAGKPCIID